MRILAFFSVVSFMVLNQHYFAAITFDSPHNDSVQLLDGKFRIHTDWHPQNRSDRFPSVGKRVKLYTSNWYHPFCKSTNGAFDHHLDSVRSDDKTVWPILNVTYSGQWKVFDTIVKPDQWFLMNHRVLQDCSRKWYHARTWTKRSTGQVQKQRNMRPYCSDVMDLLDIASKLDTLQQNPTPLLGYFGDGSGVGLPLPFFAKYRSAATSKQLPAVTGGDKCVNGTRLPLETVRHVDELKPILWKLESSRHFAPLMKSWNLDTPWEKKKARAFWAGDMTGHMAGDSNLEKCLSNQRCKFVLEHARSGLIDCGLTKHRLSSNVVNGTNIQTTSTSLKVIQSYKIIISLEGNDVASGLKWSLLSESVVLMPRPTQTSWAMEELLEPWVHYIPMSNDGSNAEEMVQWVLNHDHEAWRIAERATLFMYDLVFHPEAIQDDRKVKEEIVRRYRELWH